MKGAYVQMCRHHLCMLTELMHHFNKMQTVTKVFTLQLQHCAQQHIPLDETVGSLTLVLQQQACNIAKKHYEHALQYAHALENCLQGFRHNACTKSSVPVVSLVMFSWILVR